MSVYLPSMAEIMTVSQSRGADSDAPELWDGLVGWWPMQEAAGNVAWDASGWRRHGVLTGEPTRLVASPGRAIEFAGATNSTTGPCVVCPSVPEMNTGNLTVMLWARTTSALTIDQSFACRMLHTSPYGGWCMRPNSGRLGVHAGGVFTGNELVCASAINDGEWHLLGMTHSPATSALRGWVDGKQDGASSEAGVRNAGTDTLDIAAGYARGQTFGDFLPCSVSQLLAWTRILLPAEIQQLYADPWAMGRLRRRVWAVGATTSPVFRPEWAAGVNTYIGLGV